MSTRPFGFLLPALPIVLVVLFIATFFIVIRTESTTISSFEECVAAGNPVMESYPRQCRTQDGNLFVENVQGYPFGSSSSASSVMVSPVMKSTGATTSEDRNPVVQVYFGNTVKDPESLHCEQSYATERIVKSGFSNLLQTSLEMLLEGPTDEELDNGYFTSMPDGVTLNSVRVDEGIAYADFSEELRTAAGSCRVQAIASQIQRTLLQFPTVADVVISIEGDTVDVLQP